MITASPLEISGPDTSSTRLRLTALDSAKAISVILVVCWHVLGTSVLFNELFLFVRMPLFLFVAGVFAAKAMSLPLKEFFVTKSFHLLWLYVLWSVIHFVGIHVVLGLRRGEPIDVSELLNIYYDPMLTLWFLYALALNYTLLRLMRPLPSVAVLTVLFAVYCLSFYMEPIKGAPFIHKAVRLLPFFALAVFYGRPIVDFIFRWRKFWWIAGLLYLILSYLVLRYIGTWYGPINFVVSALGVFSVIGFCKVVDRMTLGSWLIFIGGLSIYVFVLHRLFLPYMRLIFYKLDIVSLEVLPYILIPLAILLSVLVGHFILRPYFPFVEKAPWLQSRPHKQTVS